MSLRLKTSLLFSLCLIIFALASYFVQKKLIFPKYLEYEKTIAVMNLDRMISIFRSEVGKIDNICIGMCNPNFTKMNLGIDSLKDNKVNWILLLDEHYQVVFNKAYDYDTLEDIKIDDLSLKTWSKSHYLIPKIVDTENLTRNFVVGMINTSKGIMLISSRLILDDKRQGSVIGVLIVGKFLKPLYFHLNRQSKVNFEIIEDYSNIAGMDEIEKDGYFIKIKDDNFIHIYKIMLDVKNDILFVLKCEISRKCYSGFINSLRYSQVSTIIFTILLFFVILTIQHKFIFKPLADLEKLMRSVQKNNDYSMRIIVKKKDELGSFANSFNQLLETIENKNTKLKDQAQTDPLTGLFNRRYLEKVLKLRTQALKIKNYSIIILDIDYFKNINDTYGHTAGDIILSSLAPILRENSRKGDVVARYGGEEFLIFLPNLGKNKVYALAERIRRIIEYQNFFFNEQEINITTSIGCASFPEDGINSEIIITKADAALYKAKNKGRNQVKLAN